MSFVAEFNALPLESLLKASRTASAEAAREVMSGSARSLADFAALITPAAGELLEPLCRRSQALTRPPQASGGQGAARVKKGRVGRLPEVAVGPGLARWMLGTSLDGKGLEGPTVPARLLLVDDYRDAVEMWALYLRARGFDIQTAADGLSAVRIATETLPDLIVMDLALPILSLGMSGDLELAIASGSTLVRIGTDVFGSRS